MCNFFFYFLHVIKLSVHSLGHLFLSNFCIFHSTSFPFIVSHRKSYQYRQNSTAPVPRYVWRRLAYYIHALCFGGQNNSALAVSYKVPPNEPCNATVTGVVFCLQQAGLCGRRCACLVIFCERKRHVASTKRYSSLQISKKLMPARSSPETVYMLHRDRPAYVSYAANAEIIGCKTMRCVEATCIAVSCFSSLAKGVYCFRSYDHH